AQLFLSMGDALAKMVEQQSTGKDNEINKQAALLSLEILARNFAANNSASFVKLVPSIIKGMKHSNPQIATSSVICLATLTYAYFPSQSSYFLLERNLELK